PIGDAIAKATGGSAPRFVKIEPVGPGEAKLSWEEIQNEMRARQGLPPLDVARRMREGMATAIPVDWKGAGATSGYHPFERFAAERKRELGEFDNDGASKAYRD